MRPPLRRTRCTAAPARPGRLGVVLGLAWLCAWSPARAQDDGPLTLDPHLEITQYIHDVWALEDGLPQSVVTHVLQSQDGYLWLGTQEGLVRFDGATFTVFDRAKVPALPTNMIRVLHEDRHGSIWIGTEGGLARYRDGRFEAYPGLDGAVVRTMYEDRQGTLWIGTIGQGLYRYDGRRFVPFSPPDNPLRELSSYVLSFSEAPDGSLWVGTANGIFLVEDEQIRPFPLNAGLPGMEAWSLLSDPRGGLWIGTDHGLVRYHQGRLVSPAAVRPLRNETITSLVQDAAGCLWMGTGRAGLFRLVNGRLSGFDKQDGLSVNYIRALYFDREGSLWIGTDGGGLNRLRPGKFTPITPQEGLSYSVALSVIEDRQGVIWSGTDGGGLNRIEGGRVTHYGTRQGLASMHVNALHEDRSGQIWAGTKSGLCRFVPGRGRGSAGRFTCYTTADGLSHDEVMAIADDRTGTLWVATIYGLNRIRDGRITPFKQDGILAQTLIASLREDRHGNLWAGTYGAGLYRISGDRITRFGEDDGLTNENILPIYEDADGVLWAGLLDGGVCRFQDERFRCFTTADGLENDKVLQILDDRLGYLWLGTQKGLFRVSKAELEAYAAGQRDRIVAQIFTEVDGLPHREMNGGTQPSAWRGRDGRLWFATVEGLGYIHPAHIPRNEVPPPVLLEEVSVDGRRVPLTPGIHFPPGSKDFTFRYTALSLAAPEKVQFQYRLEGNDEGWIDAGTRREKSYTNLPPGTYRFHLKASNNDGLWSEATTSFTFHVEPFFYQTAWFYLLCAVAGLLLAVGVFRWRVHKLRTRQAELTQLVQEQTHELLEREHALQELNANLEDEVKRQLDLILAERRRYETELIEAKDKAEESARLKTAILRNMSHEIRTPITAILGFAHVLSEEVGSAQQEFVTYISENGRRLLNTLNSILDLAKLETDQVLLTLEPLDLCATVHDSVTLLAPIARRKNVVLRHELPGGPAVARLDRNGVERILQNLLGNAIKFTDEGEVVVSVAAQGAHVVMRVRDTGIGIGEDFLPHLFEEFKQESTGLDRSHEGSGLGLAITRRLVDAMGGTIDVESEKGRGTTFIVSFPAVAVGAPAAVPAEPVLDAC